jgi:hypothetical protein
MKTGSVISRGGRGFVVQGDIAITTKTISNPFEWQKQIYKNENVFSTRSLSSLAELALGDIVRSMLTGHIYAIVCTDGKVIGAYAVPVGDESQWRVVPGEQ